MFRFLLVLPLFLLISACAAPTVQELEDTAEYSLSFTSEKSVKDIHSVLNRKFNECFAPSLYNILVEIEGDDSRISVLADYGVYMTVKTVIKKDGSFVDIKYYFKAWEAWAEKVEKWVTGETDC